MSVDLGKKTGKISLEKGQSVTIASDGVITATVEFSSRTDYDVYAIVLSRSGTVRHVATFGAQGIMPQQSAFGVEHQGDVRRGGTSDTNTETLTIVPNADVDQVAVCVYSAQSNGIGSFRRYRVSMTVANQAGDEVRIEARDASDDEHIYTCVPAIIKITPDGVAIDQVERYSRRGSEYRPDWRNGALEMDAGPVNNYK